MEVVYCCPAFRESTIGCSTDPFSIFCRFRELLLEYSGREDNSETLLEVLDPVVMKPSFSTESFAKHPIVGMAASQLSEWVQRVLKLHSTLQTKIRPLQMKVANMKVSWKEYSDKLKKEESKVKCVQIML